MTLTVKQIGPGYVAELGGVDLAGPLDDATWAAIYRAYLDHKVIVLHGQSLTAEQFYAFGNRFGPVEPHTLSAYHHPDEPGITILSNRVHKGKPKGIRDAGSHWHSDYSYKKVTANATLLHALEIPAEGGDTIFADMTAAYEALPAEMRARIDGLKARHQYRWHRDRRHPESRWTMISADERRRTPTVVHPVVRTHPETGRRSIFVFPGVSTGVKDIVGLAPADSDNLLRSIFDHCTQPRFQYRHKWRGRDLVTWDNRAVMHHATTSELPPDRHRTLHRINTTGSIPV